MFYTGLVAELYAPLRSSVTTAAPYAAFIRASGEPALELGCGDGEPMLELRSNGVDVEGLDASPDMLERCRRAAAERGVDVVLHQQPMETMDLHRRYRTIFLAGPTFNLLPDDETALQALTRIRAHLAPGASALIPLFIPPDASADLGRVREAQAADGSVLRLTSINQERDETLRRQTTTLRYERVTDEATSVTERPWILHWHTQAGFRELVRSAGLATTAVMDPAGAPATASAEVFAFWLGVADTPEAAL